MRTLSLRRHRDGAAAGPTDGAGRPPSRLVIENLHAYYGPAQAVAGVDLVVEPGQVLGLVGNNGAGKTTLLRTIAGLHRKATGRVEYSGASMLGLKPEEVSLRGLSLLRDGGHVFENLTISDHLALARRLGALRGKPTRGVDELLGMFPALADRGARTKAGYLSGGQRQILGLAMAVGSGASCLLLDEPSAGLAESTATHVFGIVRGLADEGISLLIAEQDARWLQGLTQRAAELEMGAIVGYRDI